MKRFVSTLATLVVLANGVFSQQQVSLNPVKDNTLYQTTDGSLSNGSGAYLFAGRVAGSGGGSIRRALMKFDVSAIPVSATIISAKLAMNMSKTTAGPADVSLQKVSADWGEGTSDAGSTEGSGALSTPNDATWIHRFFPGSSWINPGGDFAAAPSASIQVNDVGPYSWGSTSQMVADVQAWVAKPSTNFGWIMLGNESTPLTAKRFDSRENTIAANRPKLTVTYTVATAVDQNAVVPTETTLGQNFPNPFNPTTIIRYSVGHESRVRLSVYDPLGREVRSLVDRTQAAGAYAVVFNASNLASGVYYYALNDGQHTIVNHMAILK